MFSVLCISLMLIRPIAAGAGIGAVIACALYFTTPAYAAFINWQLQHPAVLLLGLPAGIALGWFTD